MISKTARARASKAKQLAKTQERMAAAKQKLHDREVAKMEKAIAAIEKRYEPKIEKLHREMREHEQKAAEHHHASKTSKNLGGLTFEKWLAYANQGQLPKHQIPEYHPGARAAWEAGESPSQVGADYVRRSIADEKQRDNPDVRPPEYFR